MKVGTTDKVTQIKVKNSMHTRLVLVKVKWDSRHKPEYTKELKSEMILKIPIPVQAKSRGRDLKQGGEDVTPWKNG